MSFTQVMHTEEEMVQRLVDQIKRKPPKYFDIFQSVVHRQFPHICEDYLYHNGKPMASPILFHDFAHFHKQHVRLKPIEKLQ